MKSKWIFFSIFLLITLIFLVWTALLRNKLKGNARFACANITSYFITKGGGTVISYHFVADGKKISSSSGCTKTTRAKYDNGMRKILVAYENNSPENCVLIEDNPDEFNLSSTDSLVLQCQ